MAAEQKTQAGFYSLENLISDFNLLDFAIENENTTRERQIKGVVSVYAWAMLFSEEESKKRAFIVLNKMLKGNLVRCYLQDSRAYLEVKFSDSTRNYSVYNLNLAIHRCFSSN